MEINHARFHWNEMFILSCIFLMLMVCSRFSLAEVDPRVADTPPVAGVPISGNSPDAAIKVMSINKSCLQPACNLANAGTLCSCGTKLGYGICSASGSMCDRCKKCMPIDPINNQLLHDSGTNQ